MSDSHRDALSRCILRGVVGSTAQGLHLDGQDDRDEMGVYMEAEEDALGLGQPGHSVYRTQPEGARSGPGDLDQVMYSLRKYVRLACSGNPTALQLLYLPVYDTMTREGLALVVFRDEFVTRQAGRAFLGYLGREKRRFLGELALPERPERMANGYDTKLAMHAVRIGMQGNELLTTGKMTLPFDGERLALLRDIRTGGPDRERVVTMIKVQEHLLEQNMKSSKLRDGPDWDRVNLFLAHQHLNQWGYTDYI